MLNIKLLPGNKSFFLKKDLFALDALLGVLVGVAVDADDLAERAVAVEGASTGFQSYIRQRNERLRLDRLLAVDAAEALLVPALVLVLVLLHAYTRARAENHTRTHCTALCQILSHNSLVPKCRNAKYVPVVRQMQRKSPIIMGTGYFYCSLPVLLFQGKKIHHYRQPT